MADSKFITAVQYQLILPDAALTTYTISVASSNLAHVSLDGTGIPPVVRDFHPYAINDGGRDNGFRLEPRKMVWKLHLTGTSESNFDSNRLALWNIFRPLRDPYILKVTKANGAIRQINCYVDGPIDLELGVGFSAIVTVPLVAPDPLWYYPTQISAELTTWPSTSFTTNVPYGTQSPTWHEWPIIKVYGEVKDLKLTSNLSTSQGARTGIIDFTGHTVPAGAVYTIDLRPGYKTIVDAGFVNKLSTLGSFSHFEGFRFYAEPQKASGTNGIVVNRDTVDASAKVRFEWYPRYIGL